jgi:MbtH protein
MNEGAESGAVYDVVVNEEEQYSIWPAGRPLPGGWTAVGFRGSREECLDHIAEVWTDMRPRSLRAAYES